MNSQFKPLADGILQRTVSAAGGAPGVVAMVTDREGNVYEGCAGKRELGKDEPMTRDSVMAIDLMLHTAGFCYEFFSHDDLRYRTAKGVPTVVSSSFGSIRTVLLHEPRERWTYGVNIDWLGRVVEQQRGKRLGEVMKE